MKKVTLENLQRVLNGHFSGKEGFGYCWKVREFGNTFHVRGWYEAVSPFLIIVDKDTLCIAVQLTGKLHDPRAKTEEGIPFDGFDNPESVAERIFIRFE